MDRIFVEGLALRGKHGVQHRERQEEQEFLIDISVEFDSRAGAKSDDISDTVDYTKFVEISREIVERNSFHLIERLADRIAARILEDERIARVEVTVRKPGAVPGAMPGVTIRRTR